MLSICFGVQCRGIFEYLCDVHPGAVDITDESFNEVHAGYCIDTLIALPLDAWYSYTVKAAFIIFFSLSHISSPFCLYEFRFPLRGYCLLFVSSYVRYIG
jgi:hypothetical protein